jgi:hypothetical protein
MNYCLYCYCYHQCCWCVQSVRFQIPLDPVLSSKYYHYGITLCFIFRASPPLPLPSPMCSVVIKLIV